MLNLQLWGTTESTGLLKKQFHNLQLTPLQNRWSFFGLAIGGKMNKKILKNQDSKKSSSMSPKSQSLKKQNRKGEEIRAMTEACLGTSTWICRNSACRAVLSIVDTFCKRCSCCICHLFDDNKDPSLWLECCTSDDSPSSESCGLSCHIECALQRGKVGVVRLPQLMQLDGSYCCASCGKISGILGYWKKQVTIAKDARRVDSLCYRIYLSFRLLDGTSRFQHLHEIIKEAKTKLETEVGPLSGVSAKMARGIVSRLSVAGEVQSLCNTAIQKADEFPNMLPLLPQASLPAACKFIFEQVTASSVVLVLIELSTASCNNIIGFKLWYSKSTEESHSKDPVSSFPRSQRRILISNLQPCTEYSFRIVSYTETGDLGHSEAKCFTKSIEILHKTSVGTPPPVGTSGVKDVESNSGFKVRDLGKILRLGWIEEKGYLDDITVSDLSQIIKPEDGVMDLDLNIAPPNAADVEEVHDCDSGLINVSPFPASGGDLDENFEYCVKMIRWLECEGYIKEEFRLKLLTWYSLRSTEEERRVVNTFIQTLVDDPSSLAGQLFDSFGDIVNNKRPRNGFCSKMWH